VTRLQPDILIVSESEDIPALARSGLEQDQVPGAPPLLLDSSHAAWIGNISTKGLGVFAFDDYQLRPLHVDFTDGPIWCAPFEITGPHGRRFDLLAVWSYNRRDKRNLGGNAVVHALQKFGPILRSPDLVVAGDFNSSELWKSDKPSGFRATNVALTTRALVSAYHVVTGEKFGQESRPTHYWQTRKRDGRSYHIDYVYVPQSWIDRGVSVTCGEFDPWVK